MAAAGSYTNFHVDFGGSSVWYNVVKGEKIFILSPPTEQNLKEFQKWHLADEVNYFTDNVDVAIMCVIEEGSTIVIPSGWVHAVYTPKDSVAFGGNFLHGYNFEMQLKIHGIEENLQDPAKYRFPYFEEMMWYVAEHYLKKVKGSKGRSEISPWENRGLSELVDWLKYYRSKKPTTVRSAQYINDALKSFLNNQEIPELENYMNQDEEVSADDNGSSYCICNGKSDDQSWIGCSGCGGWYHQKCVGLTPEQVESIEHYYCSKCQMDDGSTNATIINTTTATTNTKNSSGSKGRGNGGGKGKMANSNNARTVNNNSGSTTTGNSGTNSRKGVKKEGGLSGSGGTNTGKTKTTNTGQTQSTLSTNNAYATAQPPKRKPPNPSGGPQGVSPSTSITNTLVAAVSGGVPKRKSDTTFSQPKAKKLKNM